MTRWAKVAAAAWLAAAWGFAAGGEQEVKAVLEAQQADWNRGDVEAFLTGYEHSAEVTFVGTRVSKGYDGVLADYRRRYPTRESMGQLEFSGLEVRMLGAGYASVLGHFQLRRSAAAGGDKGGYFTLLFRRTAQGWKIILDHTS